MNFMCSRSQGVSETKTATSAKDPMSQWRENPDSFNCIWTYTEQLLSLSDVLRISYYDLIGELSEFLGIRKEIMEKSNFEIWDDDPSFLITEDISIGFLFGEPIPWTKITGAISTALTLNNYLVVDVTKFVHQNTSLCHKDGIELDKDECQLGIQKNSDSNGFTPPSDLDYSDETFLKLLVLSYGEKFEWIDLLQPADSGSKYIFKMSGVGKRIVHLLSDIEGEIKEILSSLRFFDAHWPDFEIPKDCNKWIFSVLRNNTLKQGNDENLTEVNLQQIKSECSDLSASLDLLQINREKRNIFTFLFDNREATISRLIKSQNQQVEWDRVAAQNFEAIDDNFGKIQNHISNFQKQELDIDQMLEEQLILIQGRNVLNHVEDQHRINSDRILSSLLSIFTQSLTLRDQQKRTMDNIFQALTSGHPCHSEGAGRVICQSKAAHIVSLHYGLLKTESRARNHENKDVYIPECLMASQEGADFGSYFLGNGLAFLRGSDKFLHHSNISFPEECVHSLQSKTWNCKKFLTSVDNDDVSDTPLFLDPFFYIITEKGKIYIQSEKTVMVSFVRETALIGQAPTEIINWPFSFNGRTYKKESFIKENIVGKKRFFVDKYNPSYFEFTPPSVLSAELEKDSWQYILSHSAQLFENHTVFRALSISSIIVAILIFLGSILLCYCLCRRRPDNTRAISRLWHRYQPVQGQDRERRSQSPRPVVPQPGVGDPTTPVTSRTPSTGPKPIRGLRERGESSYRSRFKRAFKDRLPATPTVSFNTEHINQDSDEEISVQID